MEQKKAEAILKFVWTFIFIDEFIKMMKNSQILVNPKKQNNKKVEKKKRQRNGWFRLYIF